MRFYKIYLIAFLFFSANSHSQVYSNKVVGKKNAGTIDSLKVKEYPYSLPIWGQKATEKGFNLPYSAGISVNYFWQESELTIDNLNVGFNNGPQYNLDQIIRFNSAVSKANAVNIRPDIWLFPFLNVYGIFGKAQTSTTIDAGVWIPVDIDKNNWEQITAINSAAEFDVTTFGLGLTPTIGVGGGWLALDMNVSWSDSEALDQPAMAFVFGPRLGKTFKFNKPESNIAVWVGAFRVHLNTETNGNLALSEVLPLNGAQEKVDNGIAKVGESQTNVDNWWESLTIPEQKNPVNAAKYKLANQALDTAGNLLNSADAALSTPGSSTVQYSLDKKQTNMWNFIVGSQYQYNKHIMLRAEVGFLGTRSQFLTSVQYRFGL